MPAKPGKAYRSYAVSMPLNRGKAMRLRVMLRPWRLGLRRTLLLLEDGLIRGERLPRYVDAKQWEGFSQRQWDSITRQARAMMGSWIELRVIDFRSIVSHSTLDDGMKRELWRINLRHAWWEPVDDEAHRMARRIMKHLRKRHRFPNPMRCRTLSMDGKIAEIQPSAMGGTFPYWARISTLDKGRPIHAPLDIHSDLNPHLDPRDLETLANHLQIRFDEDGGMTVRLMTTQDKAEPRVQGDVVGLDWGLSSLFATSEGRLYGLRLFAWLQQRDEELLALTRDLARSNVGYRDSKRFRRLNKRIRDHVTNEVNRVLNLIADDRVMELVVEDLDFRHGGLSKRLNRIVTRAGRNAVRAKLERLHALKGIHHHPGQPRVHQPGMPPMRVDLPREQARPETLPLRMLRIHMQRRHRRRHQHQGETFPPRRLAMDRQTHHPEQTPQRARPAMPGQITLPVTPPGVRLPDVGQNESQNRYAGQENNNIIKYQLLSYSRLDL